MAKNIIQEQRMKKYFLEATKEILISEGIEALSVRNVAERAGYSYATLYNYYKGLPELISQCISDFQKECHDFIKNKTKEMKSSRDKIKHIAIAYVDYLLQYPSLFNLFYLEKLSSIKVNHSAVLFIEKLLLEELDFCSKSNNINEKEVNNLSNTITYLISGMLLLYSNRSFPEDYTVFKEKLELELDTILKNMI